MAAEFFLARHPVAIPVYLDVWAILEVEGGFFTGNHLVASRFSRASKGRRNFFGLHGRLDWNRIFGGSDLMPGRASPETIEGHHRD
jgi:hypothetical protein